MMGPIESEIHGVKCDATGCGWSDMSVQRAAYPAWRNAPCPACGANVFTDADWKAMRRIERVVGVINALLFFIPRPKKGRPAHSTTVELGGRGVTQITLTPVATPPPADPGPGSQQDADGGAK